MSIHRPCFARPPGAMQRRAQTDTHATDLGEATILQQEVRNVTLGSRGTLLHSSRLFPENKTLRNGPGKEPSWPCILGIPSNHVGAWEIHEVYLPTSTPHQANVSDLRRYKVKGCWQPVYFQHWLVDLLMN